MKIKTIAFLITLLCNTTFAATPKDSYPLINVSVKSEFMGTTISGTIPQPADYGPDVIVNPIDSWTTVYVGAFPVDATRDIFFWDNVKIVGMPSLTADCGKMLEGAKEIMVVVEGHYPVPHAIRCHVESIF
jgi:hypothetical protein